MRIVQGIYCANWYDESRTVLVLVSTHGVRIRLHGHVVPLRRTWSFLLALVYDICILNFYSI